MMRTLLIYMVALLLCGCMQAGSDDAAAHAGLGSLGSRLFFDARLSTDGTVSCATCHDPARAFADGRPVSVGVHGRQGTRNAPSLLDVDVVEAFFWDGRESDLAEVVLQPFSNAVEMGHEGLQEAVDRVREIAEYRAGFSAAVGRDMPDAEDIGRALAAFLRSLDAGSSRYERAVAAGNWSLLTEDEQAGLQLFRGTAQCGSCHLSDRDARVLTDNRFHHAGIGFERIAGNLAPLLTRIEALEGTGAPLGRLVLEDAEIAELGHFVATRRPQDLGAFRTPTLRNVANTAPYMHDGSVATLEEAIERELYYRGISLGRPINLTVEEQRQLAAFLRAL